MTTFVLNQPSRGLRPTGVIRPRSFHWQHRQTPDLIGALNHAEQVRGDAEGFAAVFAWARAQDFEPDHAERMRRDAWGRSDD
jgi:hypothetical protein